MAADDTTNTLLLQLGDQCQYAAGKINQMTEQVQGLVQQQKQLENVIGSLIGITTAVEFATSVALVMAGLSLYILVRRRSEKPHKYPLPQTATIPVPPTDHRDEGAIDTLAELAKTLTKERLR
jgi:hypothetical protein